MKRYLIFAYKDRFIPPAPSHTAKNGYWQHPRGGWSDYLGEFDKLEDFSLFVDVLSERYDRMHVVDTAFPKHAILPFKGAIYHNNDVQNTHDLYGHFMAHRLTETTVFDR